MSDTAQPLPTSESIPAPAPAPAKTRMMSIDALRGFDMFWISGGGGLVASIAALLCHPNPVPWWLPYHMEHVEWTGFVAWDLIMPLFLFLSGVSIPFAYSKRLGETHDYGKIYRRMARRFALLWILGMIAQGNLLNNPANLHVFSNTLQSIAVGYVIASIAFLHLSLRKQIGLCAGLLGLYWALMMFVPAPGTPAGWLEPHANLALWVDETIMGRFRDGTAYAWILPGFGFGASVLLGSFAGQVLRVKEWTPGQRNAVLCGLGLDALMLLASFAVLVLGFQMLAPLSIALMCGLGLGAFVLLGSFARQVQRAEMWTPEQRIVVLCGLGAGCLLGGFLWSFHFPIIKHLWTSSMVLWAAGLSYLLLALFYLVIDVWGFRKLAFPLVVIGANAIVAYMLPHIVEFEGIVKWVGRVPEEPSVTAEFVVCAIAFAMLWVPLYVLYRKNIFVKV